MDEYCRRRRDFSNSLDHRFSSSAYDYLSQRNYNFNRRGSAPSGKFYSMSGPDSFYGSTSGMAGTSLDGESMNIDNGPRNNLIVNYLPQSMTDKDLYALFSPFGPLDSCRVMRDYKSGYSYGFGFVKYLREEDALAAIGGRDGFAVQNKRLKVSFARPSSDAIKGTNLYVSNLPHEITDYQLEVIFGKYGRIVQKNILRDKMGICRGVAFVRFDRREEAQEAISALNNVIPEGGKKPLSVKVAEDHGKLKAALFTAWNSNYNQNRGNQFGNNDTCPCSVPRIDCIHQRNFNLMMGCGPTYGINNQEKQHFRSKERDMFGPKPGSDPDDIRHALTQYQEWEGDWGYTNAGIHPYSGPSNNYSPSANFNMMGYNSVPNMAGNMRNAHSKGRPGGRNNPGFNMNVKPYKKFFRKPHNRNNV